MNPEIPAKLVVKAQGTFESGLAVRLKFAMSKKNDYYYDVYLNEQGEAQADKDELLREFDQTRNLFLMDYMNPRGFFTGQIAAHVMTTEEIEDAISTYERYKKFWEYPPGYLEKLRTALTANSQSKCVITLEQSTG